MICSGIFGVSTCDQIKDSSASLIHYKQLGLKFDMEDCDNPMFPAQKETDIRIFIHPTFAITIYNQIAGNLELKKIKVSGACSIGSGN
jgi:hypothetical protein